MSFLHLSLLAGLAVVTVPIMLHLFGQRQPQLIDFPALRFVQETRQEQSSSWQLRHILLLLLRILLLAALALALSRPRVHSVTLDSILIVSAIGGLALFASVITAIAFVSRRPTSVWLTCAVITLTLWSTSFLWGYQALTVGPPVPSSDSKAPVATAIIVDNGPTMSYRAENQVRLDVAKEHAAWILDQLPVESRVGVLSGVPIGSLALDPASAEAQIKLIEPRGAHVDLPARIRTALDLVLASELERKEIYVITDLMSPAWTSPQPELKDLLDQHQGEVLIQIIDVGTTDHANWSLGDPKPSFETIPVGSDLELEIPVARSPGVTNLKTVTVDLIQESMDPRLPVIRNGELQTAPSQVVDRQVANLENDPAGKVTLTARNLSEGTHHFTIRLDKSDPLDVDNARFVSIIAQPQKPALIVADNPEMAYMLELVVDPTQERDDTGVEQVRYSQLGRVALENYALLWLHDPPPLTQQSVERIRQWVEAGGGLLVMLGPALGSLDSVRGNAILSLLPGQLGPPSQRDRSDRSAFLTPVASSHPMFHELGDLINAQVWNPFAVFINWTFESYGSNAFLLMEVSDNRTAGVVGENVGRGQIITFTTPIPQLEVRDQPLWNELWIADNPVPAFGLLRGALDALFGSSQTSTNFQVATPVSLPNDPREWPSRYELYLPNAESRPVESGEDTLDLGEFEQVGIYRLRGLRGEAIGRGFSINAPASDTRLERVDASLLEDQLGASHFRIARDRSELESSVGQARFGRELYPLLMIFVAGLFLAEQAMSNRFYKIKFRST